MSDALRFPAWGLTALPLPFEDRLAARQSWWTRWVVAVRIGFTEFVQSTTACSATFVAVRVLGGAVWNQTQFAFCTGHRAYPLCSLCARGVCSRSCNSSSRDVILLPIQYAAPERGFVLMCRRTWVVDRAVAALNRAVGPLNRRIPPCYTNYTTPQL